MQVAEMNSLRSEVFSKKQKPIIPRKNKLAITNIDDPKVTLVAAIIFALSGGLSLNIYWEGFVAWYRICTMSYQEVRATPFLPIWTSMRAVTGILSLITSLIFFSQYIRLKRLKSSKPEPIEPEFQI